MYDAESRIKARLSSINIAMESYYNAHNQIKVHGQYIDVTHWRKRAEEIGREIFGYVDEIKSIDPAYGQQVLEQVKATMMKA
jgi:hypothetical protein